MRAVVYELNHDAVPFPSKDTRRSPVRRGWAISSIHTILHNARYIGDWTWNKTRFLKTLIQENVSWWLALATSGCRLSARTFASSDAELWHAVQARLAEMVDESGPSPARRPPGGAHACTPRIVYPVSSAAVCAPLEGMSLRGKSVVE